MRKEKNVEEEEEDFQGGNGVLGIVGKKEDEECQRLLHHLR